MEEDFFQCIKITHNRFEKREETGSSAVDMEPDKSLNKSK